MADYRREQSKKQEPLIGVCACVCVRVCVYVCVCVFVCVCARVALTRIL